MKIKLLFVIVLACVLMVVTTKSSRTKIYTPRQESRIDKVRSYLRPGGQIAAGMAEYFGALRANPLTGTVSIDEYNAAIDASLRIQTKRSVNSVWKELGPDNVGGRTRAFLQDKDTPSTMYAGSVSGGLFRSITRGTSWKIVNDFQENLNVSCITQNTDGVIIYGTGENAFVDGFGNPSSTVFQGAGIFRSVDRGRSFTRVNSTIGFGSINSMASEKSGGSRMYVSTPGAIRYSDDGLTWITAKTGGASKEVKVDINGVVYAEWGNGIVKSTTRGTSWTTITPPGSVIDRASIAISPQDPNYIYIMASQGPFSGTLNGVYRSKLGGAAGSWEKIIAVGTTFFDPLNAQGNPQGRYDNVLTVNPMDKNHIIMGGVFLAEWKEGNNPRYIASVGDGGGANSIYVHADKHVLEWDMSTTPPTLIVGTDGGFFFSSDNLKTYNMKNHGFNATQFYGLAADYEGNVVGGTQDNGTQYINKKGNTPLSAVEVKGGDGFHSEISVKNNAIMFSETYYGNLIRSRDFGKSQSCIWDRRISKSFIGLTDTAKYCAHNHLASWAPFSTKFRLWEHPDFDSTLSRLFIARNGQLWMAINVHDFQKEPEWYLLATAHGSGQVWDIEPTRDGNSVFITNSGNIYRIDGLNSATYYKWSPPTSIPPGITITNLNFALSGGRAVSSIGLDPNDNNSALITLGNYGASVYIVKGSNMLGTPVFTNITNNLPAMPVYDGFISIANANILFVGTDLGVYASDNGGTTWSAQTNSANKFPKVATLQIRQYDFPNRNQGSIYAGTHGRGIFECQQYKTSVNSVFAGKSKINNITAYPNPASTEVNIKVNNMDTRSITLNVIDFTGKTVFVKVVGSLPTGEQVIHIETLTIPTGTYVLTLKKGTSPIGTVKLVIRH